jgi:hypothetical protein
MEQGTSSRRSSYDHYVRPYLFVMAMALAHCASNNSTPATNASSEHGTVHFFGVVKLPKPDLSHKGKIFSGVLIEADGGPTWVVSYEHDGLWEAFEGRRVEVTGERFVPQEQALVAAHVRVTKLSLERSDPTAKMTRFEEERTFDGKYFEYVWPEGTALAGEKWVRFVTNEGREFFLAHRPKDVQLDQPTTVHARVCEPSIYAARPGGEYLWVYDNPL